MKRDDMELIRKMILPSGLPASTRCDFALTLLDTCQQMD